MQNVLVISGAVPRKMMRRITALQANSCDPHKIEVDSALTNIASPRNARLFVNREAQRVSKAVRWRGRCRSERWLGAEAYVRFLSSESNHLLAFSHYRQHSCSKRCTHNSASCFSFIMTGLLKVLVRWFSPSISETHSLD